MHKKHSNTFPSVCLQDLPPGSCCTVKSMGKADHTARLKSMGICLGRTLEVLKTGDPLIVRVYGTRIGLSRRLAEEIQVESCKGAFRCWEIRNKNG